MEDKNNNRDNAAIHHFTSRSASWPHHCAAELPMRGGAMRRMSFYDIGPSMELEGVQGMYVPIGYARYVSPVLNPYEYEYFRVAGWRIAVPRTIPGLRVRDLLDRIFYYGPQSAGYMRLGDTLVPATLEPGDRMTLAQM